MVEAYTSCKLMELTRDKIVEAAKEAIRRNARNNPLLWLGIAAFIRLRELNKEEAETEGGEPMPEAEHLALLTTKYWGSSGVRLTVGFLDNAPSDLKSRIVSHMNAWAASSNVAFAEIGGDPSKAQVRITRTPGQGYYSYLGTDVLQIPPNQCTMNLDSFSMNTPESEYKRVVRHETGHTLGYPHEHARQEIVSQLDPQKTTAYFMRTQGWSARQVQQQILTPLNPAELTVLGPADETSIMAYSFPGAVTKDGQPIPGGSDINASDHAFAASIYPKADVPPEPKPPEPPVTGEVETLITLSVKGGKVNSATVKGVAPA